MVLGSSYFSITLSLHLSMLFSNNPVVPAIVVSVKAFPVRKYPNKSGKSKSPDVNFSIGFCSITYS